MARQNIFICGGERINSIGDLYDNFNFEELKRCIAVGKLQFWLRANGHDAEAAAVEKLDLAAPDADLLLLAAINAPEEKRAAYLAQKRELEEAAARAAAEKVAAERAAAEKAEAEANAVKSAERERKDKRREIIAQLIEDLEGSYCETGPNSFVGGAPPSVLDDIRPVIAKECGVSSSRIKFNSKLTTFNATGDTLKNICRSLAEEKRVPFDDAAVSTAETFGDLAEILYHKMVPNAFLPDAPPPIAGYRRWILLQKVRYAVCEQLKVEMGHIWNSTEFASYNRYSSNKVRATPDDLKAICGTLKKRFVITFATDEIKAIKTVGDIVDLVEAKMIEEI